MLYAAQCDMHGEHYSTVYLVLYKKGQSSIYGTLYIQVQIFDTDLPGWLLLHLYHCHIFFCILFCTGDDSQEKLQPSFSIGFRL